MTTEQKLKAAIAFCGWVIECDEKRTPGEWRVYSSPNARRPKEYANIGVTGQENDIAGCDVLGLCDEQVQANATFIAGSTVWSAPLAKVVRRQMQRDLYVIENYGGGVQTHERAEETLSHFTDKMLAPFV